MAIYNPLPKRNAEYAKRSAVKDWLIANATPFAIDDMIEALSDRIIDDTDRERRRQLDLSMLKTVRRELGI